MATLPSLILSQADFRKLSALLRTAKPDIVELLEEELNRANILPEDEIPSDVVTMNSRIAFLDLDTKKEQTVTLSYPHEADIESGRVSVLAPVGAALIGLRVGQSIDWPLPERKTRRIQVTSVFRETRANEG